MNYANEEILKFLSIIYDYKKRKIDFVRKYIYRQGIKFLYQTK